MPLLGFSWQSETISVSLNENVDFSGSLIRQAFQSYEQFLNVTFVEETPGAAADVVVARLDEVKVVFPGLEESVGLAVVITDPSETWANVAYVGLETHDSLNNARVAVHEIGHVLGLADNYRADPVDTVMSITNVPWWRPQAQDIEELQALYGPSARDDVIIGGDGDGAISGGDGDDVVYGNRGIDVLFGNTGADTLYGGKDNDHIYGGQNDDWLEGNAGNDRLFGNLGDDLLIGGGGDDFLWGGEGNDTVSAGPGDDIFYGGGGDDVLVVEAGVLAADHIVLTPHGRVNFYGVETVRIGEDDFFF